ncbi:hypothetical protein SEVIR_9G168250v4 [Setaria viridis]
MWVFSAVLGHRIGRQQPFPSPHMAMRTFIRPYVFLLLLFCRLSLRFPSARGGRVTAKDASGPFCRRPQATRISQLGNLIVSAESRQYLLLVLQCPAGLRRKKKKQPAGACWSPRTRTASSIQTRRKK